ncbi:hypothetical protein J6590_017052 [Homalodisca vitripennis]|nr:hypothetical protein J6590_017052 [Homalodisca vitripennis]
MTGERVPLADKSVCQVGTDLRGSLLPLTQALMSLQDHRSISPEELQLAFPQVRSVPYLDLGGPGKDIRPCHIMSHHPPPYKCGGAGPGKIV